MDIKSSGRPNGIVLYYIFGLFVFVAIFFLPFIFETNDDTKMMMFVSGGFSGFPESYAVYIHPLLSHFLAFLYGLPVQLPWYPLFWFLFFYLSYSGYLKVIFGKVDDALSRFLFIVAFLVFVIHSLFYLQFTVVAGVLAFSGYLLILTYYQGFKISTHELWLGYFLCFLAILVRRESFYLFTIGFGIVALIHFGWREVLGILSREKFLLLGLLLVVLSVPLYEKLMGYQDYILFNVARHKVLDHPVLHRINIVEDLQPDLFFFKGWYFRDNPSVTLTTLHQWKEWLDSFYFEMDHLRYTVNFFLFEVGLNRFVVFLGLLYIIICFFRRPEKRIISNGLIFLGCWTLLAFILNYFYMIHARVQSILVLMILGAAVSLYQNGCLKPRAAILISTSFIAALVFHLGNVWAGVEGRSQQQRLINEMVVFIPEDAVYFMDWRSWNVRHLDPKKLHHFDLRLLSLGWGSYHPADRRLLESKGFKKLQDIENFYYIHAKVEEDLRLPEYMGHLQKEKFRSHTVAENISFRLIYYELP